MATEPLADPATSRVDGDQLQIWNLDGTGLLEQLTSEGRLRRVDDRVVAESLSAYLAEHGGEELFSKLLMTLERVR